MIDDIIIACEKCGIVEIGVIHLADHLRKHHSMTASQAIPLAKEMCARYREKDERIRRAAPELLAACEKALSFWERYVDRVGPSDNWAIAVCDALRAAIAKARG